MRSQRFNLLALGCFISAGLAVSPKASAVPITSGTGPGGVGLTNGSSSLEVWYQANTIGQSNGSPVTAWTDGSGNGNHAGTIGSNPSFITPALNGQPSVQFTGSQELSVPGLVGLPNFSIIAVAQSTGDRYLMGHNALNRQIRMRQGGGGTFAAFNGVENPQSSAYTTAAGDYLIADWLTDSASDTMAFFERGALRGSGALVNGFDALNRLSRDNGTGATQRIAEIAIFSSRLGDAVRLLVDNALSAKYGISMLANDRYAGDDGVNGDYDSNVFGIGRLSALDQLTNSGQAGFGTEALSLDNGDFLMSGHDGTVNSLVALESPPLGPVGQRWDRAWYVDKTGALDATLAFDFEDSGLASPAGSNTFQLLYSADGDFSDGWSILAETAAIASGTVVFNVLDGNLLDGYYTLGLNIQAVPEPSTWLLLGLGSLCLVWQTRRRRSEPRS